MQGVVRITGSVESGIGNRPVQSVPRGSGAGCAPGRSTHSVGNQIPTLPEQTETERAGAGVDYKFQSNTVASVKQ